MTGTQDLQDTEPWMRATELHLDALRRGVLHALQQAAEDAERFADRVADEDLESKPFGLPSVAFHLRHIAGSLDRLLTYAEDGQLTDAQLTTLAAEKIPQSAQTTRELYRRQMDVATRRIRVFRPEQYEGKRGIGRKKLPTTVGGLLVHCAEHTQRHAGQMATTAKLVMAIREDATGER